MRKRFDRYAFVRAWRVSVDERPDPRDTTLLRLYKGEGLGGAAWTESATLTLLHSYVWDRASEVFIDKNSINHRVPRDKRLASLGDYGPDPRRRRNKEGEGEPLCCWSRQQRDDEESPAFTSRWFTIRPCDYSGFLARNKRPSSRGGGSGFNLTAFITRYRA